MCVSGVGGVNLVFVFEMEICILNLSRERKNLNFQQIYLFLVGGTILVYVQVCLVWDQL